MGGKICHENGGLGTAINILQSELPHFIFFFSSSPHTLLTSGAAFCSIE
jgi:hypothetical protein